MILYTTKINVIDLQRKEISISVERYDDIAETTTIHRVISALVDTPDHKLGALSALQQAVVADEAKQVAIASVVSDLEDQIKTQMEAWELTR